MYLKESGFKFSAFLSEIECRKWIIHRITHHKVIVVHAEGETICEKVIILESHSSLTMMLHSEYQGGFEIG